MIFPTPCRHLSFGDNIRVGVHNEILQKLICPSYNIFGLLRGKQNGGKMSYKAPMASTSKENATLKPTIHCAFSTLFGERHVSDNF